ncbi:MAG: serine/threonine-protein kinase [Myxococcota bacterium]|nr:serine/threonine-protein kinase [Myxococcota bacterium]
MGASGSRDRSIAGIGRPRSRPSAEPPPEGPSPYEGWIGRVVDERYALTELLAEGGMGAVFEARHVKLGRPFAVKVMLQGHEGNEEIVQRFAREVAIAGRLSHRHIVNAIDCGEMEDGVAFLVLELVSGRSLAEALYEDGAFGWRRAARVGAELSEALWAAHDNGVVHRDLKPDNVVLEPDGDGHETVKLLDFGVAHIASGDGAADEALTQHGAMIGTVGYMAPEQALGHAVDGRSDLYALGILLWEMVQGEPLFDESLSASAFVKELVGEARPPLSADVPDAFADLVDRLLSFEMHARPASAADVQGELRALLALEDAVVLDAETGDAPSSSPPSDPSLEIAISPPPPRRRVWPWIVAALALAAAGALAFSAWERQRQAEITGAAGPIAPGPTSAPTEDPVEASLDVLLDPEAPDRAREEAATAILAFEPPGEVSPLARTLAELESETDCRERRAAVLRLGRLGDPRVLPILDRFARRRCGRPLERALTRARTLLTRSP